MPFLNRQTMFKKMIGYFAKIVLILFLVPVSIICYFADDILDEEKQFTLGYQVIAVKE
jgi:hypothetical protein